MSGRPARSAMVRAILMMRVYARADRPRRSMMRSKVALQSAERGQKRSRSLEDISALVKMPVPANRFRWTSRACSTRAAMAAEGSPLRPSIRALVSTGWIQSCRSIQIYDI